jgi:hypothetical protein
MKNYVNTIVGLAAVASIQVATTANAGVMTAPKQVAYVEPAPISMFTIQPYATYAHSYGTENNADSWGAGISMLTPGFVAQNQFEFGYDWRNGNIKDLHTLLAYARIAPLEGNGGVFQPYLLAGPSFTWGFPSGQGGKNTWNVDVGVGARFLINDAWSAFTDYRYRWDLENKLDDSGFVRLGFGYSF